MAEKAELAFGVGVEQVTWRMVNQARSWVRQYLRRTPLLECPELSDLLGVSLLLKAENLQWTGSFKVRGGLVKLLSVPEEIRGRGVVCASTGNHGKGIAFLARQFSIPAWVVVPDRTPTVKTEAIKALGARLIRFGDTYAQAEDFAKVLAAERELVYAPSFDDPWVVAAQATIAWEILEDAPEVDTLIVPVGGGALLAGSLIAAVQLKPSLKVLGVEAEGSRLDNFPIRWRSRYALGSSHPRRRHCCLAPWNRALPHRPPTSGRAFGFGERCGDDGSRSVGCPVCEGGAGDGRRCTFSSPPCWENRW